MARLDGEKPDDYFGLLVENERVVDFFYRCVCFTEYGGLDYLQIEAKARMLQIEIKPALIAGLDSIIYGVQDG